MATERVLNMDEMLERFRFLGRDLPRAVFSAMLVSSQAMLSSVTRKLRGEYLNVDTGRGRQSMQAFAKSGETKMQAGIDTDVIYMKAHEEGFHGRVQVRAHTRQMYRVAGPSGRATRLSARTFKAATRRGQKRIVYVRAHHMQMNIRARRFMRDSINQEFDATQSRIERALVIAATTGKIPTPGQLARLG